MTDNSYEEVFGYQILMNNKRCKCITGGSLYVFVGVFCSIATNILDCILWVNLTWLNCQTNAKVLSINLFIMKSVCVLLVIISITDITTADVLTIKFYEFESKQMFPYLKNLRYPLLKYY